MSADYTTTITVAATPQQAYDAISDVSGWWGRITGRTTAVGDEFVYVVPGLHYSGFRVTELEPGRRIAWLVTGSHVDFVDDKQEWNGTTVRFGIEPTDAGTAVTFTHEGLTPEGECYGACSNAWSMFVNGSLKTFIETGQGTPYLFAGDEALTGDDHEELHRQVRESIAAR
ncbi:SRPBCC family protein [Microbacterium rhizosphaerae]|uniref:SRPBCC domain-containing protein n=1 Tax=Microbacterium rhizosphaerae TaxID=1678237 RepID=A0ABZ0SPC2_9MICO|nr:SRPBCC domain-containing protein [Microbacterium rhizosphaerae]WPR90508.1 SRPBCC domain-containing protein [Microbacterium rhizosphaerae]